MVGSGLTRCSSRTNGCLQPGSLNGILLELAQKAEVAIKKQAQVIHARQQAW